MPSTGQTSEHASINNQDKLSCNSMNAVHAESVPFVNVHKCQCPQVSMSTSVHVHKCPCPQVSMSTSVNVHKPLSTYDLQNLYPADLYHLETPSGHRPESCTCCNCDFKPILARVRPAMSEGVSRIFLDFSPGVFQMLMDSCPCCCTSTARDVVQNNSDFPRNRSCTCCSSHPTPVYEPQT